MAKWREFAAGLGSKVYQNMKKMLSVSALEHNNCPLIAHFWGVSRVDTVFYMVIAFLIVRTLSFVTGGIRRHLCYKNMLPHF